MRTKQGRSEIVFRVLVLRVRLGFSRYQVQKLSTVHLYRYCGKRSESPHHAS